MSKYIAQIIINGVSIFTRSFINAYQQALRNAKAGGHTVNTIKNAKPTKFKMQTDEALKILSIERHELNPTLLEERYKKLYDANDPAKGGSFYLLSKIYRSKEVLDYELTGKVNEPETTTNDASQATNTQTTQDTPPQDPPNKA